MEVQVIEKIQGRIDRATGLKINTRLRVAAYARVSTDSEDQLNSLESQVKYYNEKINKNNEWLFVEVYADESISGTQDYKHSNFMRMIQDSLNGKIDLILTKSISRFARNTLDTLKYVRMLKEKNVAILFEEENINTLEMAGELLLTILSSVAQQESETISSHVKLGLKMKQQRGELIGYNGCLGYTYNKESKSISVNEEEAEIVKYIFSRYAQGVGSSIIAKELTNMKYQTPKGKSKIKRVENNKNEVTINVVKENLEIKWEKEDGI
jgi:site-specific DNA recombinase